MRKTYSLETFRIRTGLFKYEKIHRVYLNIINHGVGSFKVFEGTYTECKLFKKQKEQ